MPSQTGQNALLGKLGPKARAFVDGRKDAEPELAGGGDLPAGIENGVAQVILCTFGKVQEGKKSAGGLFFQAQAIVKLPKDVGGVPIAGRRTRLYKIIASAQQLAKGEYDEKALAWAQDQIKMLAGKGASPAMFVIDRLEATAAIIQKAKPHTLFRTWKGSKSDVRLVDGKWWLCNLNDDGSVKATVAGKGPYASDQAAKMANPYAGNDPMVQHTWGGAVPWVEPSANGQAATHVQDETPTTSEPSAPFDEFAGQDVTSEPSGDNVGTDYSASNDLDALAATAPDDESARVRLSEIAGENGIDEETVNASTSWEAVVEMIRAAQTDGQETDDKPWVPEKSEVYGYRPSIKDTKTKKFVRAKNPIDCEVTSVDAQAETVSLRNTVDKKTVYKDVTWADLIHSDD